MDLVEDTLNQEPFLVDLHIYDLVPWPARIFFDLLVACPKFVGDEGPQGIGIRKRNTVHWVCVPSGAGQGERALSGGAMGESLTVANLRCPLIQVFS